LQQQGPKSRLGIGSESNSLFGQSERNFGISHSDASLKIEKSEDIVDGV